MKTKLSPRFWCALTLFSLVGQIAWVVENMYFNVFIYNMFRASAADISLMVAASAVAATLTTVFIGALSDKIGKRKLFICLGYILWGVSIFSFVLLRESTITHLLPMVTSAAAVGISLTIVLDCVMTFFGSSANDAAFNAWLTDSTDSTNRGAAEGINSMMPLVAILAVFGGFMFFDLKKPESWTLIFTIIGIFVCLVGIIGFFIIKEPDIKPSEIPYFKGILYGFLPSTVKKSANLYISLAAFIIFNISIQIFMPYLIIYYEVSLGMENYVLIMAPAIILASVATALWGKVYDKKGFTFSGIISVLMLIAGYTVLFFFRHAAPVFIGSLLMMCGYLSTMAVFGALIRENTPAGKAGMFQGVRIFSQVLIPGVVGPFIGKTVLAGARTIVNSDGTTSFVPSANIFLAALAAIVLVIPFFFIIKDTKKSSVIHLETPFESEMGEIPLSEYPRPSLKRDSYFCLNGKWKFTVKGSDKTEEILVPFPPESRLSGICRDFSNKDTLIYERKFTLPENFIRSRVILNFGAVDQYADVFINGTNVTSHTGGYLPFSADITDALCDGENTLTVEVRDPLDKDLPYGKQCSKRGGMWYTKTSGIWQTVWLESVPENHIERLEITSFVDKVTIKVIGGHPQKTITVGLAVGDLTLDFTGDSITISPAEPVLWTPENPYLYNFTVTSGDDTVSSYFALREVCAYADSIHLNGKPYFFHGLLDQGYYSDGIFTPASYKGYETDILKMKECGFNMLRKHIKVEPEIFYYLCDVHGMAVFQDFVNNGKYSFMIDTALPTVLPKTRKMKISHKASERRKAEFMSTSSGIISHLYNHPSVVYYTIFNEGWGQFDADKCYNTLKALDPSRIYDTTSGWFRTAASDVESEHIYFKPADIEIAKTKPTVLSEFGGYVYKVDDHSANPKKTYGYKFFDNNSDFEAALIKLYESEIIPLIEKGLSASVLTQVSDVEDETNGLLTYDRKVCKVNPSVMRELADELYSTFNK